MWRGAPDDAWAVFSQLVSRVGDGAVDVVVEGETALALFDDRERALHVTLACQLTASHGDHHHALVAAGLGWGAVARYEAGWYGPGAHRARRLVRLARPGDVLADPDVVRGVALPSGIGTHGAPPAVEAAFGGPARLVVDYRDMARNGRTGAGA